MDGFFGWQQVAVGDRLLALHWGPQGGTRLLEDIGAHVLHDGAHYDHAGEIVEENDVTFNSGDERRRIKLNPEQGNFSEFVKYKVGGCWCGCALYAFVPFIVKLQSVLPIKWRYKLPDHSLGFLPLISSKHPDMGYQPCNRTDGHAAHFALDIVSNLLRLQWQHPGKRKDVISRMKRRKG